MSSSYKNVRLRHPSGAPINSATPLPVDVTDANLTMISDSATPLYVRNATANSLTVHSNSTTPVYILNTSAAPAYVMNQSTTPIYEIMKGQYVRSSQVGVDSNFPFASPASTPVNSQLSITITPPANPCYEHQAIVYNPSTESDMTLKVFHVCTPGLTGSGTSDAYVDTLTIPKSQSITGTSISNYSNSVFGIFNGGMSAKFVMSNNTALATPVTPTLRLREVF